MCLKNQSCPVHPSIIFFLSSFLPFFFGSCYSCFNVSRAFVGKEEAADSWEQADKTVMQRRARHRQISVRASCVVAPQLRHHQRALVEDQKSYLLSIISFGLMMEKAMPDSCAIFRTRIHCRILFCQLRLFWSEY